MPFLLMLGRKALAWITGKPDVKGGEEGENEAGWTRLASTLPSVSGGKDGGDGDGVACVLADAISTHAQQAKPTTTSSSASAVVSPAPPPSSLLRKRGATAGLIEIENINEWEELVESASPESPLYTQFSASWCQPCKKLRPVFEALAKECNGTFVYFDTERDADMRDAAVDAGIATLPTFQRHVAGLRTGELTMCNDEKLKNFVGM